MTSKEQYTFSQLFIWGTVRSKFFGVFVRGISTVSSFFVIAVLSVYQYGLYQLVLAAVAVGDSFISGIFDDILLNDLSRGFAEKRLPWAKRLFHEIFALKFILGFAAFVVLFFGASLFAAHYGKDIANFVRIMSFLFLIRVVRDAESMFFGATVSLIAFSAGTVQELLRLFILAAFWYQGNLGLTQVLLSTVIASAAALLYTSFFFIKEYLRILPGVVTEKRWIIAGIVREFGKWVFIRYGLSRAFKQMDTWFIRIFLNTEAVALYSLTINLVTMVQSIFPLRAFSQLLPWETANKGRMQYIYRRGIKYFFWSGLVVGVGSFLFVPEAIALLLPKYLPAMPLFRIFVLTLPLFGIYKFQKIFLIVLREQKILTMRILTEAFLTAATWVVFLPLIKLYAAVVEFVVTYCWRVALFTIYIRRKHPHLSVRPKDIFTFDANDWLLVKRSVSEIIRPRRWLKPVRAKI